MSRSNSRKDLSVARIGMIDLTALTDLYPQLAQEYARLNSIVLSDRQTQFSAVRQ